MTLDIVSHELWLRRFHPLRPGAPRLVCFPHAGGSASWFYATSRAMTPDVTVSALQYPGRQDRRRETIVKDVPALADRIAEVLAGTMEQPTVFFGHSMGAVVAFEVARRLAAAGQTGPAHLFVSGRRAPDRHRDERVHLRDDDGILDEVRSLNGTDAEVLGDPEVLRMALPVIRGDYQAIETYRYQSGPVLSCDITALSGDRDPKVTIEEADAWRELTTGRFRLEVFRGGHFFLNEHAEEIQKIIRAQVTVLTPRT